MRLSLPRTASVALVVACSSPADRPISTADSAAVAVEVMATLRAAYDLSTPGLTERMLGLYPGTGPIISASAGSVQSSRDSLESGIRYFWDNVGVNMRNARWIWDSAHVTVLAKDAASVTASYRIPHLNPRNEPHMLGGAMTMVFQKRDGRWVIVQEHLSDLPQGTP